MNKCNKIIYILPTVTFALLATALFATAESSKIVTACLLLPLTLLTCLLIKKRTVLSINKREVLLIVSIIAVLYVMAMQLSGLFFKFYKNPYFVNSEVFFKTVIPLAAIIIEIEIIRYVLLAQSNKVVSAIAFLSCVLAEVLAYSNIAGITSFNRFMDLVGMTLFPAITANIYYHYISKSYGALPNIAFRLISALYIYFVPTTSGMNDALVACIKLILPIIMLLFISALFDKKKKNAVRHGEKFSFACAALVVLAVVSVAMLISCQFRYGALVVGSESMTGEINKGDAIIYERYEDQKIEIGQVVVFTKGDSRIIHRVIDIERVNGELRYYTKGDANEFADSGYITDENIIGLTNLKIPYVGYPTIWIRNIFGTYLEGGSDV